MNAYPDPVLTRLAKILPVPYNHYKCKKISLCKSKPKVKTMELVRIRILSADPDPGGKMKVDPCWYLMPSSAFVFYLTPGFVMFELRRTLLFEKNLVWIQIRKRKNRILVEKGWTVLCFSHLLFWAGSWIPFWEGHFLMQKPEFVAFFLSWPFDVYSVSCQWITHWLLKVAENFFVEKKNLI